MHAVEQTSNVYKARFCGSGTQSASLQNKKVVLLISVGQRYHENGKLAATIDLINRNEAAICDVMLADTLQHYNALHRLSKASAVAESEKAGDAWINRNASYLRRLRMPHKILRWNTLLQHQDFSSYYHLIKVAYQNDSIFKQAIDTNIQLGDYHYRQKSISSLSIIVQLIC